MHEVKVAEPTFQNAWVENACGVKPSVEAIRELRKGLSASLEIPVTEQGFVPAATRNVASETTGYDACWVRDSVWIHWALRREPGQEANSRKILDALASYFGSSAQRERMHLCIGEPARAWHPHEGAMQVPHIRFNWRSPELADVCVGGQPQRWSHKQNDALGFYVWAALVAWRDGFRAPASNAEVETLATLVEYLVQMRFYDMEDSGSWEEIEKVNNSSIAFCIAALEAWKQILPTVIREGRREAVRFSLSSAWDEALLQEQIDHGYRRLFAQWPDESGSYVRPGEGRPADPKYRGPDAALLGILYPLELARVDPASREELFVSLEPLFGERGVRRYLQDSYQCAGYWDKSATGEMDSRTDDYSEGEKFAERARGFKPGTEAQWFFDSWLAAAFAREYARKGDETTIARAWNFFRRAAAQITSDDPSHESRTAADGVPVGARVFPESYNVVVRGDAVGFRPSPITPLNWAKASFLMAMREIEAALALTVSVKPTLP